MLSSAAAARRAGGAIVVGSKNFTEQLVLGELLAQTIERDAGLPVDRRLNLGGTLICDRALLSGDIDVYVEYTGTALTAVFHQPVSNDSSAVFETVRDAVRARAGARCCRRSASTTRSRSWCAAPTRARAACGRSTMRCRCRRAGAPASATSSSSGPTAIRAWRRRTVCGFPIRRA